MESSDEARKALRAFIHVRRKYSPSYANLEEDIRGLSTHNLCEIITRFVAENSEGGKRAQAVVAGLLDLFAGDLSVMSGRINDPDRHLPGDVGIKNKENPDSWEKVFEVRDKAVSNEDVYLFIQKAIENGVKEAAVLCAHASQTNLNTKEISDWASKRGVTVTFFLGWADLIEQVAFWSEPPQIENLKIAPKLIYKRLIEIEASEEAIKTWVGCFNN